MQQLFVLDFIFLFITGFTVSTRTEHASTSYSINTTNSSAFSPNPAFTLSLDSILTQIGPIRTILDNYPMSNVNL